MRAASRLSVTGSVTAGQPCAQSVECASGLFCQPTDPTVGLAGTCTALKTAGETCGLFDNNNAPQDSITSEEACSYRGSGAPALRCNSLDPVDSSNYSAESTWTCEPAVALGEACNTTVWCANGICDPATFTCVSMGDYFSQSGSCEPEVIP